MKHLRLCVPFIGALALLVLFLKMPESPNIFGIFKCKTCANDPYLPIIGGGYFALLIALSLLFSTFPGVSLARGGLIWAVLLAATFTYMSLPNWCVPCLVCHICNIAIWSIWWMVPSTSNEPKYNFNERIFLTLFAPLCTVALFSSMNLTFLVYNLKTMHSISKNGLQSGEFLPNFSVRNEENLVFSNDDLKNFSRNYINFVSPNCPYCEEQLSILKNVTTKQQADSFRIVNIGSEVTPGLTDLFSNSEWFKDKGGKLRSLFKVSGYPTLFIVGADGKILEVIAGVSQDLKDIK